MAKHGKQKEEQKSKQKAQPFNNPFEKLRRERPAAASSAQPPPGGRTGSGATQSRGEKPVEAERRRTPGEDEAALFLEAVGAARALPPGPARPAARPSATGRTRPGDVRPLLDEADAQGELASLVAEPGRALEACAVDESGVTLEAAVRGFDPKLMRRLRAGELDVSASLDLHGRTAEAARGELERFVSAARRSAQRCVLVISGRGLHSGDAGPVLRERVSSWLRAPPLAKELLAFCRAQPRDGGDGAYYLLLRRSEGRTGLDRRGPRR